MSYEFNLSNQKLFQPDIFSKEGPVYRPVSEELRQSIASVLTKNYFGPDAGPITVYGIGGNEINSRNFKINVNETYFVAKKMPENDRKRLDSIARLHDLLSDAGKPVPKVVRGLNGDACVCEGLNSWLLMEYVEGKFFDGKSPDHLFKIAECFDELSLTLRSVDVTLAPQGRIESLLGDENELWSELKADESTWHDHFGPEISTILSDNYSRLEKAVEESGFMGFQSDLSDTPLTHIDWHPHNILVDKKNSVHILDIDSINVMNPSVAAAFGAYKILRQFVVANQSSIINHQSSIINHQSSIKCTENNSGRYPWLL